MQELKVSDLKPHPQNNYFFDDIQGDNWDDFLDSIKQRGVIEPIVVTQDLIVVSGHQRVRACIELKNESVLADIRHYKNDDEIIMDLIDTNLKQRGIGNPNPIKLARCLEKLKELHGISQGRKGDNLLFKKDICNSVGITEKQMTEYLRLLKLIPELQDLIDNGNMKPTVGYKVWYKLSKEDQEKLFLEIGKDKIATMTQKEAQKYIDKINNLEKQKEKLESDLQKEKNKKPEIIDNTDYKAVERANKLEQLKNDLETKNKTLENSLKMTQQLLDNYKVDSEEYRKIKLQMAKLQVEKDDASSKTVAVLKLTELANEVEIFLYNKLAPTKYKDFMMVLNYDEIVKENFIHTIELVGDWYREMKTYVNENSYENIIIVEEN